MCKTPRGVPPVAFGVIRDIITFTKLLVETSRANVNIDCRSLVPHRRQQRHGKLAGARSVLHRHSKPRYL